MRTLMALGVTLQLLALGCSDDGGKTADSRPPDSAQTCPTSLLPADGKVGDFKRQATPETATNLTALTALINGGAEKYTQGGKFVCMARVKYTSATKTHTLDVRVFDETDAAGAESTYTQTKNPDDQDLSPTIGDASRGHENTVSGIFQADMRKKKYVVRVIADKTVGKTDALSLLEAIAGAVN